MERLELLIQDSQMEIAYVYRSLTSQERQMLMARVHEFFDELISKEFEKKNDTV